MVMVARASAAPVMQRCQNTPLRFASTAREAAAGQDSALLRVLKSEIDHEAEEYEPSRVNFSLLWFAWSILFEVGFVTFLSKFCFGVCSCGILNAAPGKFFCLQF